jgi:transposase-like protein
MVVKPWNLPENSSMNECPRCKSQHFIKNGTRQSGDQSFHCKNCDAFFTANSNGEYPKHRFDADCMKLCVLWYFRYPLSYRNVAEMMALRRITVSHQSVFRWVAKLGKEFGEKARNLHGQKRTVSWYVDETYVKVKGHWKYLYRAVDRNGEVLDVMLSAHRSKKAVTRFFKQAMKRVGVKPKRVYTDKNSAFIEPTQEVLEAKHGILHITVTPVERSHVPIKRRYSVMRGFGSFMRAFQFTWNWEAIYGYLGNLNASTHREREEFCQNIRWLFGLKKAF